MITTANKENPSSLPNNENEKDLTKLECPFTWNMHDITNKDHVEYNLNDDEELFPLIQLMRLMMTVYVGTKANIQPDEILEGLTVCDDIMVAVRQIDYPEISADVVHYILQCTKCFVYVQLDMRKKLKRIYSKMKKDWQMDGKERGTLMACRSICWSKYQNRGSAESEHFMREATKENPSCDLWHFILGKSLRRGRLLTASSAKPSKEELRCFKKAYSISSSPIFGVFLAQMFRDMGRPNDAEDTYSKILAQNPTGTTILLRLAFGFIRLKNDVQARVCLRKIAAGCTEHSVFIHYLGIFHFNYQNCKEAAEFLKGASKNSDVIAGKQHLDCAVILDKPFDVVQYLQDMVHKKDHLPEEKTQSLLDLTLNYWLNKRDVPKLLVVYCAKSGKSWLFMGDDDFANTRSMD